jgi:hypothetical protein
MPQLIENAFHLLLLQKILAVLQATKLPEFNIVLISLITDR